MMHRLVKRMGLLLAMLVSLVNQTPPLVLCIGEGGHYAIEVASADCCSDGVPQSTNASRCADRCVDTPLTGISAPTLGSLDRQGASPSPSALAIVMDRGIDRVPRRDAPAAPGRAPAHSSPFLRTTVIRC